MSPIPPMRWSGPVHAGLCEMLNVVETGSVAVFDWDDTCIKGDISHALLTDLCRRSGVDHWAPYLAACDLDRKAAYTELTLTLVAGHTPHSFATWTREVLESCLSTGEIAWSPEVAALFAAMRNAGWDIWVVTASPIYAVQVLAQHYGLPAERVLGMQPTVRPDGQLTAPIQAPVPYREGKLALLQTRTGRPSFAAGDSESDRTLLEAAQFRLFVDSGNTEMQHQANAQGWWHQQAWT